jgi:transketolase
MLDSLRAMPNLHVFRPADRNETKAAYVLAMKHRHTPTVISLSRQNTPYIAGNGAGCTSWYVYVWSTMKSFGECPKMEHYMLHQ